MNALIAAGVTFIVLLVAEPLLLGLGRLFGVFTIVRERRCHVYVLFGTVIGKINEPGLHFLWPLMGWKAGLVNWLGNHTQSKPAGGLINSSRLQRQRLDQRSGTSFTSCSSTLGQMLIALLASSFTRSTAQRESADASPASV